MCLEDWVDEANPVRVIVVFVDELDLGGLGFGRAGPGATGRPGYHPSVTKGLKNVRTEMALNVLAYNPTRVMNIIGIGPL